MNIIIVQIVTLYDISYIHFIYFLYLKCTFCAQLIGNRKFIKLIIFQIIVENLKSNRELKIAKNAANDWWAICTSCDI